jgi:hypothetical protein
MQIDYRLTAADQRVFVDRSRAAWAAGRLAVFLGVSVATALLSGWALWRLRHQDGAGWQAAELFFVAALLATGYLFDVLWRRLSPLGRWLERFTGDYSLVLTPAGFAISRDGRHDFVPWPDIRAFEETERHWVFHCRRGRGFVVPKSALPTAEERGRFAEEVRQSWAEHASNRGLLLPERPTGRLWGTRTLADLAANLAAGYRFAVFRPAKPADFRADPLQLALLLGLQLAVYVAADYLLAGGEGARFNVYGFTDFGAAGLLFLLSGVAMAGRLSEPGSLLLLLVAVAASELAAYGVYLPLYAVVDRFGGDGADLAATLLYVAWVAWMLAIAFRAVVALCGYPRAAALLPVSLYALFNLALVHALPEEEFFDPPPESPVAGIAAPAIDGEALFYRQPELVDAAVAKLAADRVGVTDLYFLGFAGEADEKVFAHEIEYVKDLFDHRFGTADRSLVLVNSEDTAERLPLANGHNLDAALQRLAERMNKKEDVLFLFLSSHGSADHHLSVQFPTLPLNDLSAARLKEILDASGIRHRVIVISACYSGGFLDALKDDYSLIVTAASRDRSSFGCGDQTEFTYFGAAYFVNALNHTASFIDAFGDARADIEAREKAEGKVPSEPQIHVGPAIVPKLKQLEQRAGAKS